MMTFLNNSPATKIGVVGRMTDSVTDYLRRHGINPSLKFSDDLVCEKQGNWNKVKE